jgi:hypothetical protein
VVVVVVVVFRSGVQTEDTIVTKWVEASDFVMVEGAGVWPEIHVV